MQNALSWLVVIGKPWETVFNHYFTRWESIVFFDGSCWKDVGFLMPSGQGLMVWSEPQVFSWFPWITFFCSMKCWGIPGALPVYQNYGLSPCFSPFSHGHILVYPIFNLSLPKLGQESSTGTSACSRPYRMPSTSRYLVWRWANGSWGVLEIEWFEILGITPECMCRICIKCIYYILDM